MHWRIVTRRPPYYAGSAHIVQNERTVTKINGRLRGKALSCYIVQIAAKTVAGIDSYVRPGDSLPKGAVFGMIRIGSQVDIVIPWRDGQSFALQFAGDGHPHQAGKDDPRARWRTISPGFFAALGVPILAGRDFDARDTKDSEPVVMVSQSLAQSMFAGGDAVGRHIYWSDPVLEFIPEKGEERNRIKGPHRIIGVVPDIDDEHIIPRPTVTVYSTFEDGPMFGADLFIHTTQDPYALVTPATRIIRELSTDQPVEKPSTLKDVRTEVLTPDRLNSVVFSVFAAVALASGDLRLGRRNQWTAPPGHLHRRDGTAPDRNGAPRGRHHPAGHAAKARSADDPRRQGSHHEQQREQHRRGEGEAPPQSAPGWSAVHRIPVGKVCTIPARRKIRPAGSGNHQSAGARKAARPRC